MYVVRGFEESEATLYSCLCLKALAESQNEYVICNYATLALKR